MKKEEKVIKYLRNLIIRCLSTIIIFLIMAIASKSSPSYKNFIISNIYEKNISFVKIKKIYQKYLGGIAPLEKLEQATNQATPVFKEELEYTESSIYNDGVKLTVANDYLVPIQKEGMVVFIGEKEKYGNVVIIEGIDGIDIWYGNMEKISAKLYDYVAAGTYLGTAKNNTLYLAYQKEGNFLNYKDYLK